MLKYLIISLLITTSLRAEQLVIDRDANEKLEVIKQSTNLLKQKAEERKQQLQENNRALANIEEALDMQGTSADVTEVTKGYSTQMLFMGLQTEKKPSNGDHAAIYNRYYSQMQKDGGIVGDDKGKIYLLMKSQKDIAKAAYIYSTLSERRALELKKYERLIGESRNLKETMDLNNQLLITLIAEQQISNLISVTGSLERVMKDTNILNFN